MKNIKYGRLAWWCVLLWLGVTGNGRIQAQVGTWRYHFAVTPPEQIAIWGPEIYASRESDLLCYNTADHSLTSLSKRNGLTGGDIGAIAYHAAGRCLIIGYKDGNIDLYYGDDVFNMSDIKEKNIAGGNDKAISRIHTQGPYAYLACGFGIVILDVVKREFKDTYMIGAYNSSLRVNEVDCDGDLIWAATDEGLRYADQQAVNLNDYTVWQIDGFWGTQRRVDQIIKVGETWWALEKGVGGAADCLYRGRPGEDWILMDTTEVKTVSCLNGGGGYLARGTYRFPAQQWSIDLLSEAGDLLYRAVIEPVYGETMPTDAILDAQHNLWAVGTWKGIMRFAQSDGRMQRFYYAGPSYNTAMTMTGKGDRIYVAPGGYDASFVPIYRNGAPNVYDGNEWETIYAMDGDGVKTIAGTVQVLEDPFERGHCYWASAVNGLIEVRDERLVNQFTADNSPLQAYGGTVRVYGIALDADGDVWMTNVGSTTALLEYRRDGMWQAYDISEFVNGNRVGAIMVDYWQHIWVLDNRDNLYVFEVDGPNIKGLQIDENNGSTVTTNRITCMLEDENGHVWLGTERGVKVIDRHAELFDRPNGRYSSVECKNIMVPSGDYIIELLRNEGVTAMVHDGANRKWIGTESNGLFLVSGDGTQELAHYTTENSGLLADRIDAVGMIPYTGEVFVSTTGGICSYMGTGAFKEEGASVLAYPNPVPPGYEGYISIRNLPQDAEVKITDAAGHLIYEARATGSQLSWNGYNMQGKRPQSGVLLVFAATNDGKQRMVCKIFYAR